MYACMYVGGRKGMESMVMSNVMIVYLHLSVWFYTHRINVQYISYIHVDIYGKCR